MAKPKTKLTITVEFKDKLTNKQKDSISSDIWPQLEEDADGYGYSMTKINLKWED